jgi:hypothetical protein
MQEGQGMRRRLLIAAAIGVCLSLIGAVAVLRATRPSQIGPEQFAGIDVGMTRADVERVLGGPPRNECAGPADVWVRRDGRVQSAAIDPGTQLPRFFADADQAHGDEAVWLSPAGLIAVRFDTDGRVEEKYVSDVHVIDTPWSNLPEALARKIRR